jgi:MarR family transcriptional regulator, organic hydroperoxide resistance regulator
MIFQVAKTHRGLAGELLRPTGLYPGQEILLMHLLDEDERTQKELIELMGIDASTVTKMVQRLEAAEFVCRTPSESDRRAIIVKLTQSGRSLKVKVENMRAKLNGVTVENLSREEQVQLLQLLQKVLPSLKKGIG